MYYVVTPPSFQWSHLRRWKTVTIAITEEEDTLAESLGALGVLDPLASSSTRPNGLDETPRTPFNIGAVVTPQYWLDGFRSLVGVVERDCGDKVVEDVRLYNTVHECSTDETEFTINGCSSAARKVPSCVLVMREGGISVLKIGYCNCSTC